MFHFVKPLHRAKRTLDAINAALEQAQETSHRMHLGASEIGKPCDRSLWYKFHWAQKKIWDGRMLRLFARGHKEEERFVAYLRAVGITVWDANPDNPTKPDGSVNQIRVSDHAGHFGGSLDGIASHLLEFPDEPALLEFKTHSKNSFEKVYNGVIDNKFEHAVQMQMYMGYEDLPRALYNAVNKDDDDLHLEIIDRDGSVFEKYRERAGRIIWTDTPPKRIAETPANPACKYCDFARLCHFGGVAPDRNCRTCRFSRPTDEGHGVWRCDNAERLRFLSAGDVKESDGILTEARQRSACSFYEARPDLLERAP